MNDLLIKLFSKKNNFDNLKKYVFEKKIPIMTTGLLKEQRAHIGYFLHKKINKKLIFILANTDESEELVKDLKDLKLEV
ncbi:MAG: hypothetical protein ACRDA4_09500, partial [Filifactoraceae bacterium]